MKLPSGRYVSVHTPIYPDSNFIWGEVTKSCTRPIQDLWINGRLIISASEIETRIIATAHHLDKLRAKLGNRPILVNSWYRPSAVNRSVGGSKWSRHQYGDAVDIRSPYLSPREIYHAAEPGHFGGISCYYSFVHIDWRGKKARW